MLNFLFGAACAAIVYTFFPVLAEKPSKGLRSAWAWIKANVGSAKQP